MARPRLSLAEGQRRETLRFWSCVRFTADGCWDWLGGSIRDGYGLFHPYGWRRKVQAHRYAYEKVIGPIPAGLTIDHLCRNRICVNPWHLEPVTNRENILRGLSPAAHHARKTRCAQGHPYDDENTYVRYDGRRACRICTQKWDRQKYQRRLARRRVA